jgi:hypothetical protein
MWQNPTVSGYREALQKVVELATSQHISAITVNAGGTGYTDGDVLTITHAGATLPCTFVVTVAAGIITAIKRIVQNGGFSNRVATVTKNAAGTGYAVNDIVRLTTGTFRQAAKAKVTAIGGGGAVTTAALFEGGGAYSSVPTATGGATNSDIGTGTGSGLTLDTTMTGLIGTSAIAATGGTGTGATFNLTLTETGWTALEDRNDYSLNSVTDEKQVVLEGTAGASEETPIIGCRTGTNGSGGTLRRFLAWTAMTAWSSSLTYSTQPNVINPDPTTTAGNLVGMIPTDTTVVCWFSISSRKIGGVIRADGSTVTAYGSLYQGLLNGYGTATENPYPMVSMATHNGAAIAPDSVSQLDISGITECFRNSGRTGPSWVWNQGDATWEVLQNASAASGSPPFTASALFNVLPVGAMALNTQTNDVDVIVDDGLAPFHTTICRTTGAASTLQIKPTPNTTADVQPLIPVTVTFGVPDLIIHGDLENVYWVSGTKTGGGTIAPEDTFSIGNRVFRVFPNAARTESYSFFAMEEGV